jgi:hypothetical protein
MDCKVGGALLPCHTDVGIGHKWIVNVISPPTTVAVTGMRVNVLSHFALPDHGQLPKVLRLQVYDWVAKEDCV